MPELPEAKFTCVTVPLPTVTETVSVLADPACTVAVSGVKLTVQEGAGVGVGVGVEAGGGVELDLSQQFV